MTKYRFASTKLGPRLPSLALIAILLAACSPATSAAVGVEPSPTPAVGASSPAAPAATDTLVPASDVQPVATSRGPNLEATDPTTVSLASGGLQLVEFFRFT